jgi:ketosteroid isomerase-like protein
MSIQEICFEVAAVFALSLCAAGPIAAQQAQSVAPGQTPSPEIKQFQGYEDQWSTAVVKADQYQLEFLLSPVYVDISATGDVTTRNQQIADLFQKGEAPVSMEQRVVSVRTFGDTAVVSGTYIVRVKTNNTVHEERGIFTHVYERANGHWACVNAQRTAVVDLTPGKQKTQQKSDAQLPFHIPLFHKGADSTQPTTAQGTTPTPPNP